MVGYRLGLVSCLLLMFGVGGAYAQEKGSVGLVMSAPVRAGVLWHATERVALRPEASWSTSTSDTSGDLLGTTVGSSSDSTTFGVGVSALFYFTESEGVRTYVSPQYQFSHSSVSSATESSDGSDASRHSFGGVFGAQYALGSRFGLFGEIGVGMSTSSTSLGPLEADTTDANLIGGVGVVFYF